MRLLVFDSGIGGIGIAREIRALMPDASLTYLMDNGGFPYGALSERVLVARVQRVVAAAIARVDPDLVVVACNTASTAALAALRWRFALPFVGCVPPVKWAASISRTRTIGVLATPATVRGPYLRELGTLHAPDCRLLVHGSVPLAALAEDRFAGRPVDSDRVRAEVAALAGQPGGDHIDAVALGCTHYAWLLPELRSAMGPDVRWLDPAPAVARQVARLAKNGGRAIAAASDGLVLQTREGGFRPASAGWSAAGFLRADCIDLA